MSRAEHLTKLLKVSEVLTMALHSAILPTYYEMFPKNALEKILWLESDRMGFFINSVTKHTPCSSAKCGL